MPKTPRITALYERLSRDDDLAGESNSIAKSADNTGCLIEHFGNADAVPQLPERCLSRKAGIVRCCHRDKIIKSKNAEM